MGPTPPDDGGGDGEPELGAGASPAGRRPFPADDPWNADVSGEPVDPSSAELIAACGDRGWALNRPEGGAEFGVALPAGPANHEPALSGAASADSEE